MEDSASLKINRATKRITELSELFNEQRPFSYVLETNTKTGDRATYAKKNEAVTKEAALIAGEAIHALRSALDHVYWEIVSPHATTDRERRAVQFPFVREAARLEEAAKQKLADRVSPNFLEAIINLRPYKDAGGNELLYIIEEFDILDKHKLLIPTGDYTRISIADLKMQIPDLPISSGNMGFGMNRRDICWRVNQLPPDIGQPVPPTQHMFEKELKVPVEIVFSSGQFRDLRPMVRTLHQLVDVTRETVQRLRTAQTTGSGG